MSLLTMRFGFTDKKIEDRLNQRSQFSNRLWNMYSRRYGGIPFTQLIDLNKVHDPTRPDQIIDDPREFVQTIGNVG